MNILLISISAPPKNSPESVQVGRYLQQVAKHHCVTLLTTRTTGGWEPLDESLKKYTREVFQIITLGTIPHRLISVIKKIAPSWLVPDAAAFFPLKFKSALAQIKVKPDVIFSRSAPFSSAMMAFKFSVHWNVPWIMHLSDPWADNPFLSFSKNNKKRNEQMERECIHRANLVTLTSPKTVLFYKKKYPEMADKFRFLPNVFDEEYVNQKPINFQEKMKFVFTGRLYGNRIIHPLLDVAEKIIERDLALEDKFEFIFAGFFGEESVSRIKSSTLRNIKYLGPLTMHEALQIQQDATVLIVIDAVSDGEMFDLFFPSKLLDYFAAKRPILAFTGNKSTTYDLVEGKYGKCFHQGNMNEMPMYLISLIQSYYDKDHDSFKITSDFAEYSPSKNALRLQEMFNEVIHHA